MKTNSLLSGARVGFTMCTALSAAACGATGGGHAPGTLSLTERPTPRAEVSPIAGQLQVMEEKFGPAQSEHEALVREAAAKAVFCNEQFEDYRGKDPLSPENIFRALGPDHVEEIPGCTIGSRYDELAYTLNIDYDAEDWDKYASDPEKAGYLLISLKQQIEALESQPELSGKEEHKLATMKRLHNVVWHVIKEVGTTPQINPIMFRNEDGR